MFNLEKSYNYKFRSLSRTDISSSITSATTEIITMTYNMDTLKDHEVNITLIEHIVHPLVLIHTLLTAAILLTPAFFLAMIGLKVIFVGIPDDLLFTKTITLTIFFSPIALALGWSATGKDKLIEYKMGKQYEKDTGKEFDEVDVHCVLEENWENFKKELRPKNY